MKRAQNKSKNTLRTTELSEVACERESEKDSSKKVLKAAALRAITIQYSFDSQSL